jgi:flagellar protein FlaG
MKIAEIPANVATTPSNAGAKLASNDQVLEDAKKSAPEQSKVDMNAAVKAAAKQIDSYLRSVGREIEFRVDEDTGMTVVTVRETATGDVIRQIPNAEVLDLARRFQRNSGALLNLSV